MDAQRRPTANSVEERLRASGIRTTRARRLVIEKLVGVNGPRTAEEISKLLKTSVPLSSLYRTLSVLSSAGILERFHDGAGVARYELAESLTGHHHHITCVNCGTTQDIDFTGDAEQAVGRIAADAGRRTGFDVTNHRLDLEGLCPSCR
jgi:Fe2+ or Zn2+ uptake regulation protein